MTLKELLIKEFNFCNTIVCDILDNDKSVAVQEYAKKFIEIENLTESGGILINWDDIYIILNDAGNIIYQVDPSKGYGEPLIDMFDCSPSEFIKSITSLETAPIDRNGIRYYDEGDGYIDNVPSYTPYLKQ